MLLEGGVRGVMKSGKLGDGGNRKKGQKQEEGNEKSGRNYE